LYHLNRNLNKRILRISYLILNCFKIIAQFTNLFLINNQDGDFFKIKMIKYIIQSLSVGDQYGYSGVKD